MVDQRHASGRHAGQPPGPAWKSLSSEAAERLLREICAHVRDRFPDRIDDASIEALVTDVLDRWHSGPLRDAAGEPVRGLRADANRAALAWLKEAGTIPAGSHEYDDLFAETVFHGQFDAAEIRAGMRDLVTAGRELEFRIVTYYLDVAELDGRPPLPAAIALRLRTPARPLTKESVEDALTDFYSLLESRRARGPR
ncbi:hypothetical protein [Couchioplanes azureus]|uniref:hypothetical protein n=1 Tax=Couchioplanes caeruleus TaxID=56438 RepID=UPI001670A0BD|nr:hypothetical protein [Couchioplanes caeruleus]GGQ65794.1 hypothetical protein GCM10010166_39280 [Couchioplanes caeruleus subsp. azureus]